MRDAVIRGVRTFLQAFLGVFIALSTSGAMGIDSVPDLQVLKRAAIAAGWAGVVAAVSCEPGCAGGWAGASCLFGFWLS
jgi:hypothetical protein